VKTAFPEERMVKKNMRNEVRAYALFPADFLASAFAATGAVVVTGATAFLSLYDVVITSFFSVFSFIVVFATYSSSLGTGIYALCLCRNLNDF
jgi:hypothetical protein